MFFKDNIAFLHIPKTAGNTFHIYMKGWKTSGTAHDVVSDIVDQEKYRTFSFIRHPYDWYKSLYSYQKSRYETRHKYLPLNSFEDFISAATEMGCYEKVFPKCRKLRLSDEYIAQNCKDNNVGHFSATFVHAIRKDPNEFCINLDHRFFEIEGFFEFYEIKEVLNSSPSKSIVMTDRAKSLIDQYDMPTYELLKLQISDNYNFE